MLCALLGASALAAAASAADCSRQPCGWDSAVAYCAKKGDRLPTIEELNQVWLDKCGDGKTSPLCGGWYWSGKAANPGQAWGLSFTDGASRPYNKTRTTDIYCKPQPKPRKTAGQKKSADEAPDPRGGTGERCAKGSCNWYEAVAYCYGRSARLLKTTEWPGVCRGECRKNRPPESCADWYWLGTSESSGFAYAGLCDPVTTSVLKSFPKTSLAAARCVPK